MKEGLKAHLEEMGLDVVDVGTDSDEPVDYPDFALRAAREVSEGRCNRGILVCGTGIGMCIAANKVSGIRGALCWDETTAELSRRHNDSNILCLGKILEPAKARKIVQIWLETGFDGGRHLRRLEKISKMESRH